MESKKQTDEEVVTPSTKQSPGALLRVAREQRGLSQTDVANRLRLQTEIIIDIENDDYRRIRRHVFILGYLRAYAKTVGLNPEDAIQLFNKLQIPDAPSYFQAWQTKKPTAFMRSLYQRERQHHPARWLAYAFVVALAVLSVAWWHTYKSATESSAGLGVPSVSQIQHSDITPGGTTNSEVSMGSRGEEEGAMDASHSASVTTTSPATTSTPVTLPAATPTAPATSSSTPPPSMGTPPAETAANANLPIPPDEEVDFPATRPQAQATMEGDASQKTTTSPDSTSNSLEANPNVNQNGGNEASPDAAATPGPKKRYKSRRSQHANKSPSIPRPASAVNTPRLPWNTE